jgi:hypothetical protein
LLASPRLASPLAHFFLSPEKFPVPPLLSSMYRTLYHVLSDTSSHMHMHAYVLPISSYFLSSVECFNELAPVFENRNSDRDGPSCPEEGEVRPWCARRSCSLRNGDVRWATLNALAEDSLKKSTEGHHGTFARVESDGWVTL